MLDDIFLRTSMRFFILLLLVFVEAKFALTVNFAEQTKYIPSSISFGSEEFFLCFYDKCVPDPEGRMMISSENRFAEIVVVGLRPQIGNLHLDQEEHGVYYRAFDPHLEHKGLEESLSDFKAFFNRGYSADLPETPSLSSQTSLEIVSEELEKADNVLAVFGAGLSAGYVPTFDEFYAKLDLERGIKGFVTEASLARFLSQDKEFILNIVRTEWEQKIINSGVSYTPAHGALKKLIQLWQSQGKTVFAYTENVDDIHRKMGGFSACF